MKHLLVNLIAATTLLGYAAAGAAQNTDNIYQIELIIFERVNQDGDEYWPKNIELSYPENITPLIDPEREAERQAQASEESARRRSFALSQEFLDSIQAQTPGADESAATAQGDLQPQQELADDAAEQSDKVRLNTFLGPEFQRLTSEKNALSRRGNYRVLFHETWLQALKPTAEAPALPISAGSQFGEHRELEGYITLGLNRYLHFESHLWLAEFVANYGQPLEHWPALPALKSPDDKTSIDAATLLQMDEGYIHLTDMQINQPAAIEWTGPEADPYAELLEAPYLIKNISVLQQKRRMRSGELHYLDHPKMGILIKIEPAKPGQ